ncbi:MAG: hypothetical protein H6739_19085 [Alphaproteobacteria bacterium]|nr:hypothetical protein [Alphaproteobacteria bacterium]
MMAFLVAVVLVSMYHLFTLTWASQNAHMRAREAVLHDDAYLSGVRTRYVAADRTPFDPSVRNYRRADPDRTMSFSAEAWDDSRDDLIGSQHVEVQAVITE